MVLGFGLRFRVQVQCFRPCHSDQYQYVLGRVTETRPVCINPNHLTNSTNSLGSPNGK